MDAGVARPEGRIRPERQLQPLPWSRVCIWRDRRESARGPHVGRPQGLETWTLVSPYPTCGAATRSSRARCSSCFASRHYNPSVTARPSDAGAAAPAPFRPSMALPLRSPRRSFLIAWRRTLRAGTSLRTGGVRRGRVVLGGDVAVTIAPSDPGFFNYGSYEHSYAARVPYRPERRRFARPTGVSLLAEVRSENLDDVTPFALYVRIRPFTTRRFDIQVGRIPPTFGRASRLPYARDNPLIGLAARLSVPRRRCAPTRCRRRQTNC